MLPSSFLLVRGSEPGYKARYRCVVPDRVTLVDIYHQYASSRLNTQAEVPVELLTADNRSKNRILVHTYNTQEASREAINATFSREVDSLVSL